MSKPNSPKETPPPKEEKEKKPLNIGGLLANIVTTVIICAIFVGINFKMMNDTVGTLKTSLADVSGAVEETEEDGETIFRGIIIDLGEFTMNLADVAPRAYLKAEVAIEVSMLETDPQAQTQTEKPSGGHGHGGGDAQPTGKEAFEQEMLQFKPAIRDAIITVLSGKTSDELATTTGKELAKEEISEQVNAIFGGEREVLRVSFGQFIMQQGR